MINKQQHGFLKKLADCQHNFKLHLLFNQLNSDAMKKKYGFTSINIYDYCLFEKASGL
jgi:hypothetical protein